MRRFVPLLILAALAIVAPAQAESWSPATTLGPYWNEQQAQTAALPDGTAVVAFTGTEMQYALRLPGGDFGPLTTLGPFDDEGQERPVGLSMNASGRAVLAWMSGPRDVSIAVREPGSGAFVTQAETLHPIPDVEGAAPIGDVASTIGADGHVYVAFGDGTGTRLLSEAPDSTTFSEIERLPVHPYPPADPNGPYGHAPAALALATEDGGSTVDLITDEQVGAYSYDLRLAQWSVSGGPAPTRVIEQNDSDDGTDPKDRERIDRYDDVIWAIQGPRPAFFWNRVIIDHPAGSPQPTTPTVTQQTWRLDAPAEDAVPTLVDTDAHHEVDSNWIPPVATDASGVGAVAWERVPAAGHVQTIRVTQRTDPTGTFGPVTSIDSLNPDGREFGIVGMAPTGGGSATILYDLDSVIMLADLHPDGTVGNVRPFPFQDHFQNGTPQPLAIGGSGSGDLFAAWARDVPPTSDQGLQTNFVISHNDIAPPGPTQQPLAGDGSAGATASSPTPPPAATPTPNTVQPAPPLPTPSPTGTAQAAVLSGLTLSAKRFVATTGAVAGRRGTRIGFIAGSEGKLQLSFARVEPGYRNGSLCDAARPKHHAVRCTYARHVATTTSTVKRGPNAVLFNGTVGKKRLSPGTYALTVSLITAAGLHSPAAMIHFVILR